MRSILPRFQIIAVKLDKRSLGGLILRPEWLYGGTRVMRLPGWLVLSIGFGTLVLLIGLLGFGAMRRAQALHEETVTAQEAYLQTDTVLREIPADIYLGDILIRDYLLDPSHITAPAYREQLLLQRSSIQQRLTVLAQRLGRGEAAGLEQMGTELQAYWESMDPILKWSPQEKAALSREFLRRQVLPRREAVIALAREISEINAANLRKEQRKVNESQGLFQGFLRRTVLLALSLGLLVALISAARVAFLERRSERQRQRAESAEEELRRLSRNLVRTQEEERRLLSRELHDAVGQMLSAMTMELGNMESVITSPDKLRERLNEARQLNAETIRGVRDLAMGLRPAMLDELGLGPALRWQGREFSRRSGIPVDVQIDGNLEGLPETHRTCIYRVVQEALTNCARHAQAKNIRISVYGRHDWVQLSIQDDGAGFDPQHTSSRGLGLIGIQERVRELAGKVTIISQPRKGTILEVEVPVGGGVPAE
jgi:signal transduction histidine kinase